MKMIAGAIVVLAGAILGSSGMLAVSIARPSGNGEVVGLFGISGGIILALIGLLVSSQGQKETKQD